MRKILMLSKLHASLPAKGEHHPKRMLSWGCCIQRTSPFHALCSRIYIQYSLLRNMASMDP